MLGVLCHHYVHRRCFGSSAWLSRRSPPTVVTMGGKRLCEYRGPDGETCDLNTKHPGQPANYPPGGCKMCLVQKRCKAHCDCKELGLACGRMAPRTAPATVAAAAPAAQVPEAAAAMPVAAPAPQAAPAPAPGPQRARSRSARASAKAEGRRYSRATIEHRLLAQWRGLAPEERPLPPPGRPDSGLVGHGTWAQGLQGAARERTQELLRAASWQSHRQHSSVHLTLYLAWAEIQMRRQSESRAGALDIGRHLQSFLPG